METEIVKIDPENIDPEKVSLAVKVIKAGGIVGFPTETVYGLAADFFNTQAVKRVYQVKKRPKFKPLTVQIADVSWLEKLTSDISPLAYQLISRFWPGPLTLILQANSTLSGKFVFQKEKRTIGIRIPDNAVAQALIREAGSPLVVPSANLSGEAPAKNAVDVFKIFDGLIEMVVDAGEAKLEVASTVVDVTVSPFKILRVGAITSEDIRNVTN